MKTKSLYQEAESKVVIPPELLKIRNDNIDLINEYFTCEFGPAYNKKRAKEIRPILEEAGVFTITRVSPVYSYHYTMYWMSGQSNAMGGSYSTWQELKKELIREFNGVYSTVIHVSRSFFQYMPFWDGPCTTSKFIATINTFKPEVDYDVFEGRLVAIPRDSYSPIQQLATVTPLVFKS